MLLLIRLWCSFLNYHHHVSVSLSSVVIYTTWKVVLYYAKTIPHISQTLFAFVLFLVCFFLPWIPTGARLKAPTLSANQRAALDTPPIAVAPSIGESRTSQTYTHILLFCSRHLELEPSNNSSGLVSVPHTVFWTLLVPVTDVYRRFLPLWVCPQVTVASIERNVASGSTQHLQGCHASPWFRCVCHFCLHMRMIATLGNLWDEPPHSQVKCCQEFTLCL